MPMIIKLMSILFIFIYWTAAQAEWNVDFSRRTNEIRRKEMAVTPSNKQEKQSMFDFVFTTGEPIQEMVILNTDKGFVPSTIRVQEGMHYRVHVVNVNEKDKNVSFVLDAFSEHHATYYGKIKSFYIKPKKEGVYTFQSPETSAQGRLVVYPAKRSASPLIEDVELRTPASEE